MSHKRLAINLIANIISFGVSLAISFLLTPYIVDTLGASAYGFVPLANNFILYFSLIMVALNSMESRFITIEIKKENLKKANIYFSSSYYSNLFMIGLLIIPMTLITAFVDKILDVPIELLFSVRLLFAFLFASFLISLLTNRYSIATFARNRLELSAIASIVINTVRAVLTIILFVYFKPSIAYIGIIGLICCLITFEMNYFFTKKLLPELKVNRKYFSIAAVKELISSGVWNSVNQLSSILMMGLSLLISNIFLGAVATGPYAIAQSIPTIMVSLSSTLCSIFVPTLIYLYAEKNIDGVVKETKSAIKLLSLILNIPIIFFMVFGTTFYSLWVPALNSVELYKLTLIILAPNIIGCSIGILWVLFPVTNKLKIPSIVIFCMGIINVSGTLILLKTTNLGIFSMPIVTSALYILYNLLFLPLYSTKCLGLKWYLFYKDLFKSLLSGLIIFIVSALIKNIFVINSWFSLIVACATFSVFALMINMIVLFNVNEIKEYIFVIKRKLNK